MPHSFISVIDIILIAIPNLFNVPLGLVFSNRPGSQSGDLPLWQVLNAVGEKLSDRLHEVLRQLMSTVFNMLMFPILTWCVLMSEFPAAKIWCFLSVNSLVLELTARFKIKVRNRNRDRVRVWVRFMVMISERVDDNNAEVLLLYSQLLENCTCTKKARRQWMFCYITVSLGIRIRRGKCTAVSVYLASSLNDNLQISMLAAVADPKE